MLHPADAFSAYVFKKGEFAYNQAITPYPSWAWWGITNRLTAELDLEAWLGGVPSFNFRLGIFKQKGYAPAIAIETMYQYIDKEFDQFENLDFLEINRQYSSWYNRLNFSWSIRDQLHIHLSGGATYSQDLSISNGDSSDLQIQLYQNKINPDASISLDWRTADWFTLNSSVSYGTTFLYADNIPRKQQFVFGSRLAPFIRNKRGFLNCFRFELSYLYNYYPDANASFQGPIGFLYWQWDWARKNKKRKNDR